MRIVNPDAESGEPRARQRLRREAASRASDRRCAGRALVGLLHMTMIENSVSAAPNANEGDVRIIWSGWVRAPTFEACAQRRGPAPSNGAVAMRVAGADRPLSERAR